MSSWECAYPVLVEDAVNLLVADIEKKLLGSGLLNVPEEVHGDDDDNEDEDVSDEHDARGFEVKDEDEDKDQDGAEEGELTSRTSQDNVWESHLTPAIGKSLFLLGTCLETRSTSILTNIG
ncbi:hypothetical protein R1sor_005190 [Riccia sorocarpa]|uniref:Uncharacterized protein n=1 Tax=Riccia sorocarpa TaxID=122646 RepID=A0ABD3HMK4_9MARC